MGKGGFFSESPQGLRDEGSMLSDLLRNVPRLTTEDPKFFVDLKEIIS